MNQTATIHARIDKKTKKESENILQAIEIALRKEFPLELLVPNRLTAQTLDKSNQGEGIESFDSLSDMVSSWNE